MLTRNEPQIREPVWVLLSVRNNRRPRFNGIKHARHEYEQADLMHWPVAKHLAAEAWDRMVMRQLRNAKSEKEIRTAWEQTRRDSEPHAFGARKLARLANAEAFNATTLEDTLRAANKRPFENQLSRRVERKIAKFLADLRATAKTMEDFQLIFYYAHAHSKLWDWAQENWDRLSMAEVKAARSLKAICKAHWRSSTVNAYGIHSWGGDRRVAVETLAATKWDMLALKVLKKARTQRQCRSVLMGSRNGSAAELEAFDRLLKMQHDFKAAKELYFYIVIKKHNDNNALRQKLALRLAELCKTVEQAVDLYNNYVITAEIGQSLIKRFPALVGNR